MRSRILCAVTVLAGLAMPVAPRAVHAAPADPLVLVIHGIGGGNREPGWSNGIADRWAFPVTEITFRQEGRENTSLTDFARNSGAWAESVQRQIKDAIAANPGRRVIIVSHSWGTVATKLALAGGTTSDGTLNEIKLDGVEIEDWITLGSPLGDLEDPDVKSELKGRVSVRDGKPSVVKNWTNVYDIRDPVSTLSHNLAGADNRATSHSGYWFDVTGLSAHTGIWTNTNVVRFIQQRFDAVSDMLPPSTPRRPGTPPPGAGNAPPRYPPPPPPGTGSSGTGATEQQRVQKLAAVLLEIHRRDCASRVARYGGEYKMEYIVSPAPRLRDGKWFVVAAWRLMEKAPGRTEFFAVFEAGDAANPQWIDEATILALAKQWGVDVR